MSASLQEMPVATGTSPVGMSVEIMLGRKDIADEAAAECARAWVIRSGSNWGKQEWDDRNWLVAETKLAVQWIREWDEGRRPDTRVGALPALEYEILLIVEVEMGTDVRIVPCFVRDLEGKVVGYVEAPESGPFRVKLDPPWESIAEKINRGIQEGKHLISPDRKFRIVTGTSGPELEAVIHAIRGISQWQLQITREGLTSHTE